MARVPILSVAGAAVAVAALAVGASAPAAGPDYNPDLHASQPATGIGYTISTKLTKSTTTETGRLALYAPANFKATLPTTAGDEAATAAVRLQLADQGNKFVDLTGSVVVAAAGQKLACVTTTTAPAVSLVANLSGGGLTLSIPMAVYPVTGDGTQYSSYLLVQCLPPPGVPKGTAGRAPEGGRLIRETLTMKWLAGPKNATSYWNAGWTPFKAGTATLDDAASVAAQAVTGAPHFVLRSKSSVKSTKTYATLSGRVTRGKLGSIKASVNIYYGSQADKLVSTRWQTTDASGRFSYETQVTPPFKYFQALARVPGRTFPSTLCQPSILPYSCAGISTMPEVFSSNIVRVKAS